jgi:hypothetical protein
MQNVMPLQIQTVMCQHPGQHQHLYPVIRVQPHVEQLVMDSAVKIQKVGGVHVLKGVALQAMQNVMPLQIQTVMYQHPEAHRHPHQLVVK